MSMETLTKRSRARQPAYGPIRICPVNVSIILFLNSEAYVYNAVWHFLDLTTFFRLREHKLLIQTQLFFNII